MSPAPSRVRQLQRAMVRMMVDPRFCAAVYEGAPCGLSPRDRALLTAVDRRAWSTDQFRRPRLTQALLEEFPATAATVGVAGVDAFFGSPSFARCLEERGSMALHFGRWITPQGRGVARIEAAIAAARRWSPAAGRGVQRGPGVVPLSVPEGSLAALGAARSRLGPTPLAALAQGLRAGPPPEGPGDEHLLVTCSAAGEVGVSGVGAALAAVVEAARRPLSRGALLGRMRRLGASSFEARELLTELLGDGTLAESPAPWPAWRPAG